MSERKCPICSSIVKGRVDKVFCSPKCKSIDQYENQHKTEHFYLTVKKQLNINRKILKKYNRNGFTTLRQSIIIAEGFNPKFFTHYWKNKKGEVYLFVYEYGFLSKNDTTYKKYILVTWQDYMNQ